MRFLRLIIATSIVALIALFFMTEARGQTQQVTMVNPPVDLVPIGSSNTVGNAEVTNVTFISIGVWQVVPNRGRVSYNSIGTTNVPQGMLRSKQDLDVYCTSTILQNASNLPSFGTNQSLPFTIYFEADDRYGNAVLYNNFTVNLIQSNGSYQLPPLPTQIPSKLYTYYIGFPFPGIKSALMEALTNNQWVPVMDSRWSKSPWYLNPDGTGGGVDTGEQMLVLPTSFITGSYQLRLVVVSGASNNYQIANESGYQILETPFTVNIQSTGHSNSVTNTITAMGGDPGRVAVIQKSTDLKDWTTVTTGHTVGYIGMDSGFSFSETTTNNQEFYRTMTLNVQF